MTVSSPAVESGPATVEQQRLLIYQWAYRLLHNHDEALDATQNVLMKTLPQPDAAAQSRSWLRRVTVNHCVDLIRQRRRRMPLAGGRRSAMSSAAASAISAPEVLERAESRQAVVAALQHLSNGQRAVLIAKTFDGDTFEAIAHDLGGFSEHCKDSILARPAPPARTVGRGRRGGLA